MSNTGKRLRNLTRAESQQKRIRVIFWATVLVWAALVITLVRTYEPEETPAIDAEESEVLADGPEARVLVEEPVLIQTAEQVEYYGYVYREVIDQDGYPSLEPMGRAAVDPLKEEKIALAKTVWGEARGCDTEGQENVVWTVLNRYDDGRFGDTILEVITRPNQFHGYSPDHPVEEEILATVERVVNRWLDGDPGPGYLYFTGDGVRNHFR